MVLRLTVTNVVEQAFEALFFSEAGSIIGLLLIIILVTVVTFMKKWMGFFTFPLTAWFSLLYLERMDAGGTFIWHFLIMMFFTVFNLILTGYNLRKGG